MVIFFILEVFIKPSYACEMHRVDDAFFVDYRKLGVMLMLAVETGMRHPDVEVSQGYVRLHGFGEWPDVAGAFCHK